MNGTLTATLYKGTPGGTLASCTIGTGVATGYARTFTINTGPSGTNTGNTVTVFTNNTTFFVGVDPSDGTVDATDGDGSYFWLIHYVDNSLTSPNDRCEVSTITHNDG